MNHKMLRPCIVKVSVFAKNHGYFPLHTIVNIVYIGGRQQYQICNIVLKPFRRYKHTKLELLI